MDLRAIYSEKDRDPKHFPLFEHVWDVLTLAPSTRHADEEELISLAWDAFDYLQVDGRWSTASDSGQTELFLKEDELRVRENDDHHFTFDRTYTIN